jgi:hypothetical protein
MDKIKLAQRTIAMLSSMIESGECHTTRSREMKENALNGLEQLTIPVVIASAEFEKDLEKAIEEGNEVGYNADGGYNYYCEGTALREVLKVIKKHLL